MLDRIRRSMEAAPVIYKGGYPYVVSPLIDGMPSIDPDTLSEAADAMEEIGRYDCDMILAPEAMGIPYATLISIRKGIPFSVIRKRAYGLEGEIEVVETTGYSTSKLYINGVKPGMRVTLIDDIISTGGTLSGIVAGLRDAGVVVTEAVILADKSRDITEIEKRLDIPIRCAVRIRLENGRTVCTC